MNLLPESQAMHLKLPTVDSDYVIDCASISSYFSDTSDFTDGLVDSPIIDGDFSEYMWMENVDEFDKEVCILSCISILSLFKNKTIN